MFSKRKFDIVSYYIRLMTIVLLGAVMISFLWGCSPGRSSSEKENPQNVNLREETNSHKETKADSKDSDAKEPSFSINTKDNIGNEAAVDTKDTGNIKVINTLNGKTEAHNENYEGNNEEKVKEEDKNGNNITLIMVGDILLHDAVNKCFEYEKGVYDYSPIFSNTKDEIQAADIAIVNQEVIIGGKDLGVSGYPSFNAPYEIGDALAEAGFDIVCHATNHSLDRGKKGLINCMDYWEEYHPEIEVLGIHDTEEDSEEIYVYEKDGIKVAFLNYTYGTNGISTPADMKWSLDLLNNKEKIRDDIQRAEEIADFTVVCPHWGTEYSLSETGEQESWARLFVENGVDLVIGTHPHVIEPIEWVEDEKTGNRMLVYYSLGNYVNWTSGEGDGVSNRMIGGMAKVEIGLDDSGNVRVNDYGVEALVCHLIKEKGGVTVYRLRDYTKELAEENEIRSQDGDFSLDYCTNLCDSIWGNLWKEK